jgi:hypothetical protein
MRALLWFLTLLVPGLMLADGLPYGNDGELVGEYLILTISDEQFREVDTRRSLTLDKAQKAFLARLFKKVPQQLDVVSSHFNDNREGATDLEVHCIWLRDRTIGITYRADEAAREPEGYWENAVFTSTAEPDRLVITHDAKVYRRGKELTLTEVFRLIDKLANSPPAPGKVDIGVPPRDRLSLASPVAFLSFSLPPPNKDAVDLDILPTELLKAFAIYASTKNVQVAETW